MPLDFSFGVHNLDNVTMMSWIKSKKCMFKIIIESAKKAITRCWYKPNPPQMQDWIDVS